MAAPTYADIWKKLSVIDVSEFVKSRGIGSRTLSWIPWSDCLAILQSHYPDFEYTFFPVTLYPDGSAEGGCEVTIGDVSRRVDLPVMDHKFDAISAGPGGSPDSRAINDGRWRAFVKAVAIFGLGFQLYRDGTGVPVPVKTKLTKKPTKPTKKEQAASAERLAEGLDTLSALIDACEEHGEVNHTHLEAAKAVISAEGPLDRVELAIKFLEKEIGR